MINFYQQTIITGLLMLLGSGVLGSAIYYLSYYSDPLLPRSKSSIPWVFQAYSDRELGGDSTIEVIDAEQTIQIKYSISTATQYPFVTAILDFAWDAKKHKLANLSKYTSLSFAIKCQRLTQISLQVNTFDNAVTQPKNFVSNRVAERSFLCKENGAIITIDLAHLVVPLWWLEKYERRVTDKHYALERTRAISFFIQNDEATINTEVDISDIKLHGRNWYYPWIGGVVLGLGWLAYFIYLFRIYRQHLIASVKKRIASNKPLIAYQQLSLNPHKDKVKSQLLRFMAEEFYRPEMNLNYTVDKLGLNRNKINALLKEELDLTFTAYLNKLRLSEVVNQITQQNTKNISEIAHGVGYNNISYFNRVFKNEYGCTPRKFREVYREKSLKTPDA